MSDDKVPVTVPWLISIGFEPSRRYARRHNCWTTPALDPIAIRMPVGDEGSSWIVAEGINVGKPELQRVHVRRLLFAIGTPVPELNAESAC